MFANNTCPSSKVSISICGVKAYLKDPEFEFDPYFEKPNDEGGGVVSYSQDESPKIANLVISIENNTPPHLYLRGCSNSCNIVLSFNGSMYSTKSWEITESSIDSRAMTATITIISKQRTTDADGRLVGFVHTKI